MFGHDLPSLLFPPILMTVQFVLEVTILNNWGFLWEAKSCRLTARKYRR